VTGAAWPWWHPRGSRPVPRTQVRATCPDGRALAVRYRYNGPRARHVWTALVKVPRAQEGGLTVHVNVVPAHTSIVVEVCR
jgi:hypothetical protein